ncbi:molecular chaperone HtpG [Lachnospiraceae bacterium ZAX-1]
MGTNDKQGMLSIESKNIFSILKKWLYTEQDIVFRELISNADDAIKKLSHLREEEKSNASIQGEICVTLNADTSRLIIRDNGLGMTAEEVQKYINNIAFSGAEEFISQNNQIGDDAIIGHFGVGFYSAFMLTDHVAIETKSYKEDAKAVRWDCTSDMAYRMQECDKVEIGTDIILYLDETSPYFKKPDSVHAIIEKFFIFSKTAIYFTAEGYDRVMVNDPLPLWKNPKDTIDATSMNTFYQDFFTDVNPSLFWIQFESIDIGVRGILFFRDTKQGTDELDGTIKIYSRGVYVGENIPELIPKFVNLQNGIIECDNLPLVVSRSSIRDDEKDNDIIKLIYECLSQEVTIALHDMAENQRTAYENHWPELNAFVKYAILQDKTFASVMSKRVIFMDIYGQYCTIQEYTKDSNTQSGFVYYASDKLDQAHYIEIFKKCKLNALLFDHVIDQPLMYKNEVLYPDLKFIRIDSNIESIFRDSLEPDDQPKVEILREKITKALDQRLGTMTLKFTRLEYENISTLIINDEQSRRLADVMEIYGFLNPTDFSAKEKQSQSTLMFNLNNKIVQFIIESSGNEMAVNIVINQLFDLSLMSQQTLKPEDIEPFINRSEEILSAALRNISEI